eukprot:jgi/Tetstr1/464050/TSEL_008855.t1
MFGFLKGIVKAFVTIGKVFAALAKLVTNFPKFLLCMVKLILISLLHMLMIIPGVDIFMTAVIHGVRYLLMVLTRIVFPILMFAFVAIFALVDVLLGDFTGGDTIGARMHRILSLFNTCLNDPRGWFSIRRWHRRNRFTRLFGVYPCMSPCYQGYEPMDMSGGLLCKKIGLDSPEYCTAAAVTRVAEGMKYYPLPAAEVSSPECREREAAQLSENQKILVRTVCQQPDEYENDYLRVPCFERYCAHPTSDETGPSTCVNLVPFKKRQGTGRQRTVMILILVISGSLFFFMMVTSIRAKQDEFVQLNQSFMQEKMRVDA